uniref:IBB domain-containing protein n=1 Tax=Glossina pallidipes TaxID=7398 RepID=A0A1B0AHA6_GLOPL
MHCLHKLSEYENSTALQIVSRRHEITVELRKSKEEDHLLKRRSVKEDDLISPLKEPNSQSATSMSLGEIILTMHSEDPEKQFAGMQGARKLLSREQNPPIDLMIGQGIVPICIQFLQKMDNPLVQFETAWALNNIASGNSDQTRCVIENNAVPHFVTLLQSDNINLVEQCVVALGNVAGDGFAPRDIVLQNNVVDAVWKLIDKDTSLLLLRNIVWLMSSLCRHKNPTPPFEEIKRLLPVLSQLLCGTDVQVLVYACWALCYVTNDNTKIQAVVDVEVLPRLVNLLGAEDPSIIVRA